MRERAHYSIMLERAKESELPAWCSPWHSTTPSSYSLCNIRRCTGLNHWKPRYSSYLTVKENWRQLWTSWSNLQPFGWRKFHMHWSVMITINSYTTKINNTHACTHSSGPQEKMCLIAMSLPIHKLCADPVCTAMKVGYTAATHSDRMNHTWMLVLSACSSYWRVSSPPHQSCFKNGYCFVTYNGTYKPLLKLIVFGLHQSNNYATRSNTV